MRQIVKLVRSLRSHLAAIDDVALHWPIVVLPAVWQDLEFAGSVLFEEADSAVDVFPHDFLDALSGLNKLDAFPLPFDRCVVIFEHSALTEIGWVDDDLEPWGAMICAIHDGALFFRRLRRKTTRWAEIWPGTIERGSSSDLPKYNADNGADCLRRHVEVCGQFWHANSFPDPHQLIQAFSSDPAQLDIVTLQRARDEQLALDDEFGGINHLSCFEEQEVFARLMSPCGYLIRSHVHEPYGPPALRDELWRQPFYTLVNWDRLYRESAGGCGEHAPPRPHDRRGHVRWLWKQAGIDRRTLPRSVGERLRLAELHKVKPVYVRPCKVRPAIHWFDDLAAHEETDWGAENAFRLAEVLAES